MRHMTMEQLAAKLMGVLGKRVEDRTRANGFFDFTFSFPNSEIDFAIVNKQLAGYGLRLRSAQLQTDYIVVESVSREPTPN